jgi:hypothetical protein
METTASGTAARQRAVHSMTDRKLLNATARIMVFRMALM